MDWEQSIIFCLLALAAIVIVWLTWQYIVAFLAVVGAVQIYHVWRKHSWRRP